MELIKWGYEAPQKHQHRTSGWVFIDGEINGEIVLVCPRCNTTWHTGTPVDDDYYDIRDLKASAARWLRDELLGKVTRRQLVLPLVVPDAPIRMVSKRRYTPAPRIDLSAQYPLFEMAA